MVKSLIIWTSCDQNQRLVFPQSIPTTVTVEAPDFSTSIRQIRHHAAGYAPGGGLSARPVQGSLRSEKTKQQLVVRENSRMN